MPKISVIVPIYNVEPYIRECVDSILNQTYGDFELILVDDGSPDGCPKICDEYAKLDKRIVVIHKENGGLSSARNAGLDIAKGEYISFVDGDDFIDKKMLESCFNAFDLYKVDQVKFSYRRIEPNGKFNDCFFENKLYTYTNSKSKNDFIVNVLLKYMVPFQACFGMYKRKILIDNSIKFEPNKLVFSEDVCFSIMYSMCSNNLFVTDEPFYNYVRRPNSIMGNARAEYNSHINEYNEMSKLLYKRFFQDSHDYYRLHHNLIMIRVKPFIKNKFALKAFHRQMVAIKDKDFFIKQNKLYYLAHKSLAIRKSGHYYGCLENLLDKYLCDFNFGKYITKKTLLHIIYAPCIFLKALIKRK